MRTTMTKNNTSKDLRQHRKFVGNIPKQPSSKAQTALLQRHHVPTPNRTPRSNSGKLKQHRHPAKRTDRSNSRRSTPPSGSNMPAPKRTDHSNKGPQAAPCSGTLQRHPATVPTCPLQSAQTSPRAAPASSTFEQHPAAAPTKRTDHSHSSTFNQPAAAAPCSSTNMPAPKRAGHSAAKMPASKRTDATHHLLEVRTPIASPSGEQLIV